MTDDLPPLPVKLGDVYTAEDIALAKKRGRELGKWLRREEAQGEERAAVVAYLRKCADNAWEHLAADPELSVRMMADDIEDGKHR